ncbi:MAG TPA: DUF3551 domain-containing protein [Pseudolabrys sp.]|jgi:hypothetical protein|nr:DUF3551 domain-containing protein [Pseudolabrys sp.]
MRAICAAVLALATLASAPASAAFWRQRPQAPWCAVYSWGLGDTRWDCSYPTLESCVPTILAGTRGFCNPNPRYQPPEPRRHRRKH